jgi:hypothetical protein
MLAPMLKMEHAIATQCLGETTKRRYLTPLHIEKITDDYGSRSYSWKVFDRPFLEHYHLINRNPGTLVVKERILNSVMVCNTGHDTTCSTIFHYLLPFAPIKEMNTYDREKT